MAPPLVQQVKNPAAVGIDRFSPLTRKSINHRGSSLQGRCRLPSVSVSIARQYVAVPEAGLGSSASIHHTRRDSHMVRPAGQSVYVRHPATQEV